MKFDGRTMEDDVKQWDRVLQLSKKKSKSTGRRESVAEKGLQNLHDSVNRNENILYFYCSWLSSLKEDPLSSEESQKKMTRRHQCVENFVRILQTQ